MVQACPSTNKTTARQSCTREGPEGPQRARQAPCSQKGRPKAIVLCPHHESGSNCHKNSYHNGGDEKTHYIDHGQATTTQYNLQTSMGKRTIKRGARGWSAVATQRQGRAARRFVCGVIKSAGESARPCAVGLWVPVYLSAKHRCAHGPGLPCVPESCSTPTALRSIRVRLVPYSFLAVGREPIHDRCHLSAECHDLVAHVNDIRHISGGRDAYNVQRDPEPLAACLLCSFGA